MWPAPSHPIPKEEPVADYVAYFGGQWLPFSEVKIDPMDRGFLVGDCVFDVARTFNGKSFRMKAHVDRLYRSLKFVRIDPGLSPEEMERISEEVISRNEHLRAGVGDYQIWQFITRGRGRWAHKAGPPAVGVCTRQIGFSRFAHLYSVGAHGVIVRTHSFSSDALDPKVKHFSRMNFNLAELEAGDRGVLQGVSRAMVFDLARELAIPIVEEDLQPYDVYTADEVFFTSTSPCVLPVTRVDRRPIGAGAPGPVARRLLATWSEIVGVDIVAQAERCAPREQLESRAGS